MSDEEAVESVRLVHDAVRQRELEVHCRESALRDLLGRPAPVSLLYHARGERHMRMLAEGMPVRIWSLRSVTGGLVDRLLFADAPWDGTQPVHLSAEIVLGPAVSVSLGMQYDHRELRKPDASWRHLVSTERGQVDSPDPALQAKIQQQRDRGGRRLELVALGRLTAEHLEVLRRLVATSESRRVETEPGQPSAYVLRGSPVAPSYRMLALCREAAGQEGGVLNCTSFLMRLFPDILLCRNLLGIADPARCRALAVRDPGFAGCSPRGLPLTGEQLHAHVLRELGESEDDGPGRRPGQRAGRRAGRRPRREPSRERSRSPVGPAAQG
jgi:hypothetical protein